MLFEETVPIYCTNDTQHINTLCWQHAISGAYSYHWALQGKFYHPRLYTNKTKTSPQGAIFQARSRNSSDHRTLVTMVKYSNVTSLITIYGEVEIFPILS